MERDGAAGAGELTGEQGGHSRPPLTPSPSTAAGRRLSALSPLGPREGSRSSEMLQPQEPGAAGLGRGAPSSLLQPGAWGGGGSSRTTSRDCPLHELQGTGPWSGRPRAPGGTGPLHKCSLKREESKAELQGVGFSLPQLPGAALSPSLPAPSLFGSCHPPCHGLTRWYPCWPGHEGPRALAPASPARLTWLSETGSP